jgi:hypothetical protein
LDVAESFGHIDIAEPTDYVPCFGGHC